MSNSQQPLYEDAEKALGELSKLLSKESSEPPGRDAQDDSFRAAQELISLLLEEQTHIIIYLGSGCSRTVNIEVPDGRGKYTGLAWPELLEALMRDAVPERHDSFLRKLYERAGAPLDDNSEPDLAELYQYFDKLQLAWFISSKF